MSNFLKGPNVITYVGRVNKYNKTNTKLFITLPTFPICGLPNVIYAHLCQNTKYYNYHLSSTPPLPCAQLFKPVL